MCTQWIVLTFVVGFAMSRGADAGIDVNGDTYDDIVVGTPLESVDGHQGVGAILVLYGGATGIEPSSTQWVTALDVGIASPDVQKGFGARLAAGDFDGDGCDDVAIACPDHLVGGKQGAGVVVVVRGSPSGLLPKSAKKWSQASPGIADKPDAEESAAVSYEFFGHALAASDFDGDGRCDLAIGVKESFTSAQEHGGAVHVLFGAKKKGLRAARSRFLHFGVKGVPGHTGMYDGLSGSAWTKFGTSLAATDVDGDGRSELVVGCVMPYDADTFSCALVFKGAKKGLDTKSVQVVAFDGDGSSAHENIGAASVFAADFDADGFGDLVFGCPSQYVAGMSAAGMIHAFRGTAAGIDPLSHVAIDRSTPSVVGAPVVGAYFGWSFAAGDFDGDGMPELAVGAPGDTAGGIANAGSVHIFKTGADLVSTSGDFVFAQDSAGIPGDPESSDMFGAQLATGDFDGDGDDDLVVAVPHEDVGGITKAGALHVFYGTPGGLDAAGTQLLTQSAMPATDGPDAFDSLGSALAP